MVSSTQLKKRIIPCLDIMDGRTVKGVNFEGLRDAGDPVELASRYAEEGADELVFLDIKATQEGRKTRLDWVKKVSKSLDIPFAVGGGIQSVREVDELLSAGADKISLNSSAVKRPELITEIAKTFGSQCVILAIDNKRENEVDRVFVSGGTRSTPWKTEDWAREGIGRGAGEILLTSMNRDGRKSGFDLEITEAVCRAISVPVIASGGAGSEEDFVNLFSKTQATGGLAASIFHFNQIPIPQLKNYLKTQNIPIR